MHNILPVLTVLAGHRVPVDVLCPLCRHEPKSLDHLMKDYESVVPIWQTILTNNIPGIGQGCITWLCDILSRGEAVLKLRITAAWWSIWRARNELVWNGKPWQLNTVVNEIQRSMETWQNLGNITIATSIPSHAWQSSLFKVFPLYNVTCIPAGFKSEIDSRSMEATLEFNHIETFGNFAANCSGIVVMPLAGSVVSPRARHLKMKLKRRDVILSSLSKKMLPKNKWKNRSTMEEEEMT
nr:uncharacterized protein LOC109176397 [Ipomoea trifida]